MARQLWRLLPRVTPTECSLKLTSSPILSSRMLGGMSREQLEGCEVKNIRILCCAVRS